MSTQPLPLALSSPLHAPGTTLVFCDDTDIQGQPIPKMRPDLRILAAVQMRSESYGALEAEMATARTMYGVSEFHATDIATSNRAWTGRSEEERLEAMTFVAERLAEHGTRVAAVWLPKGEYPKVKKDAEKLGPVSAGFKHALKRALVRSVVERLANGTRPAMLWLDQDKPGAAPKVEKWPDATFLTGGGPIVAPSHLVGGLQLADLAVWSIQRFMTKRAGFDDDSATVFDEVAMTVVAGFPTGIDDLRGDDHADWAP